MGNMGLLHTHMQGPVEEVLERDEKLRPGQLEESVKRSVHRHDGG